MPKNAFVAGAPTPMGELTALPQTPELVMGRGPREEGGKGRRGGGEGRGEEGRDGKGGGRAIRPPPERKSWLRP